MLIMAGGRDGKPLDYGEFGAVDTCRPRAGEWLLGEGSGKWKL
jgi:hypothetical protein